MRKLEALKVGGVQREEKKKNHFLWIGKLIFLFAIFSLLLFTCTSKMISGGWDSTLIALKMKHSPWRSKEVIMDGQFYPIYFFSTPAIKLNLGLQIGGRLPL
jgi:hypothetical protein